MKKIVKKPAMKKAKAGFDLNKDGKTTFKDVLIGRGVLPKTAKKGKTVKKALLGSLLGGVASNAIGGLMGGMMGGGGGSSTKLQNNNAMLARPNLSGSMKKGGKVVAKKKAKSGASVKKAQDGETMIGNAGAMRKTKMKERSPDGNYVVKRVTRTTPEGETTSMKVRRSVQGFLKGAPTVAKNKSLKGVPNTFFSSPDELRREREAKFKIPPLPKKKAKSGTSMKKCRYGCK
jgi:hypothetical protein